MPSNFDLSSLAKSLKAVGDAGAALCADCESRATDGKVADADIGPLTKALFDVWTVIAPTGEAATDTDPTLEAEEKKLKGGSPTQETARGDRARASDSRGVIHNVHDIFLSGETSQAHGLGIDAIFGNSRHTDDTSIAPSLSDIFGGSKPAPKLGEG